MKARAVIVFWLCMCAIHFVLTGCVSLGDFLCGFSFGPPPQGTLWTAWCRVLASGVKVLTWPLALDLASTQRHMGVGAFVLNSALWGILLTALYALWLFARPKKATIGT